MTQPTSAKRALKPSPAIRGQALIDDWRLFWVLRGYAHSQSWYEVDPAASPGFQLSAMLILIVASQLPPLRSPPAVSLRRPMKHLTPILRQGSDVAKQVWDRVGHGRLLHRRLTTSEAVRRSDGNGGDLIIELIVVGWGPAVRGLRTLEGVARHFGADCDAIGHLVL